MEAWREMTWPDQSAFLDWTRKNLQARWTKGDRKYQSSTLGFQGDPIDHAIEEAFDLLLYLWVAKRKQVSGNGHQEPMQLVATIPFEAMPDPAYITLEQEPQGK